MRRARGSIVAVFLALGPPSGAAQVAVIVADEAQARGARPEAGVNVLAFDDARLSDPIQKGLFLARLNASDRVIAAAGGDACGWLGREVEDVPVDCVVPYDAVQVLDFARSAGWRRVAVVHTPGYEKVYARLLARARDRGIELVNVPIARTRELPEAVPRALETAQALWILGDPLLTEGAAFDYIVNATLTQKVPLIAPGADLVARGAFLGAESDSAGLLRHALAVAASAAKGEAPDASSPEVPGGRLVVNQVLARRWGLRVPGGPR